MSNVSNRSWSSLGVRPCPMLLPAREVDLSRWAVVACDQYTSQPAYWEAAERIVGDAPSTLRLMLPEIYLGGEGEAERIAAIHAAMRGYLQTGVLAQTQSGAVLVTRTVDGKTRTGLVLAVDLEQYDYSAGSRSLIRATEGTIIDRIPPRMRIRKGAPIELPHILVLIDDPQRTVLEPLAERADLQSVYDFDLMQQGGHVEGRFVPESEMDGVKAALFALYGAADGKYRAGDSLLFAVGDGNHSLATAKACWEELKQTFSPADAAADHPARYALCEIENVHDAGIVFEPIHRLLFGVEDGAVADLLAILRAQNGESTEISLAEIDAARSTGAHVLPFLFGGRESALCVPRPAAQLDVGTLQSALDAYLANQPAVRIDYVHGGEVVRQEGAKPGNLAFFLSPMRKEDLFRTVVLDGALPRKTFSMGEAHEKRYYLEARRIGRDEPSSNRSSADCSA